MLGGHRRLPRPFLVPEEMGEGVGLLAVVRCLRDEVVDADELRGRRMLAVRQVP
ncbi:hypothetical protein SCALM49S_00961 [Streptomyces californicus]